MAETTDSPNSGTHGIGYYKWVFLEDGMTRVVIIGCAASHGGENSKNKESESPSHNVRHAGI